MILGGDLGGTKTLLALADADGHIVRQQRYASADYADFTDLLDDFLAGGSSIASGKSDIASACFGVAGPTDGQTAKLTYLPWQLSAADLARRHNIAQVRLVNDFAAAAHGLSRVAPEHLVTVQTGLPDPAAPRLILGAGTGLGVAGLLPEKGRFRVVPGEGGHVGFAPQTPEQGELWRWLLAQQGRVTIEDIVSGPGLARVYAFLGGSMMAPEAIGEAILRGDNKNDHNNNDHDGSANTALAHRALQLWLACLGSFAGDLALHWLARGGVYLAGGVIARLLPHVDHTPLINAFRAKREYARLMPDMPLHIVTDQELGLRGALAMAVESRLRRC